MCAGSFLANRELYLIYMRLINSLEVVKNDDIDCHPLTGNSDPKSLVAMPLRYKSYFKPRSPDVLRNALVQERQV